MLNAFLKSQQEEHERPEFVPYSCCKNTEVYFVQKVKIILLGYFGWVLVLRKCSTEGNDFSMQNYISQNPTSPEYHVALTLNSAFNYFWVFLLLWELLKTF